MLMLIQLFKFEKIATSKSNVYIAILDFLYVTKADKTFELWDRLVVLISRQNENDSHDLNFLSFPGSRTFTRGENCQNSCSHIFQA